MVSLPRSCARTINMNSAKMKEAPTDEATSEQAPNRLNGSRRYGGKRMKQKVTVAAPETNDGNEQSREVHGFSIKGVRACGEGDVWAVILFDFSVTNL